jgi:hypothetical protein
VGFVMDEVALGQVFCCILPVVIPPMLHTCLSSGAGTVVQFGYYHMLETESSNCL